MGEYRCSFDSRYYVWHKFAEGGEDGSKGRMRRRRGFPCGETGELLGLLRCIKFAEALVKGILP